MGLTEAYGVLGSDCWNCFLGHHEGSGQITGQVLKRFKKIHFKFQGEGRHIPIFEDLVARSCYALRFADYFMFEHITIDVKMDAEGASFDKMLSAFKYLRCINQNITILGLPSDTTRKLHKQISRNEPSPNVPALAWFFWERIKPYVDFQKAWDFDFDFKETLPNFRFH
jgi:hypothetical protein